MTQKAKTPFKRLPEDVKVHIERLERIRQDFVANVSHELRTPLTVIRGYLEALLKEDLNDIKSRNKIFKQMFQHCVRMEEIIDDLLLLSRLEASSEEIEHQENLRITNILEVICEDAKNISGSQQHKINLQADEKVLLQGSEKELKSLFSNIIVNAVKYTPANGIITVDWYAENEQGIFKVTDTGIGIAKKHIPRITERFYRIDKARSRESGGTGLGLAIVKHVLMRHQGELEIQSELGKGSTFICKFPKERVTVLN